MTDYDERFSRAIYGRGWYRWFAWYPVKIDERWRWLTFIERLRVPFGYYQRMAKRPAVGV